MSAIINIENTYRPMPSISAEIPHAAHQSASRVRGADTAEFSPFAEALARAIGESSWRIARLRAVREQIATGVFETPERIDGTAERLLDVIA